MRALGVLACVLAWLCPLPAQAQPAASGAITVQATPLLGGAGSGSGWTSFAIRLANNTDHQLEGTVELVSDPSWAASGARTRTRAPFALAPRGRALLELPSHGSSSAAPVVGITVFDSAGAELARASLPNARGSQPLLFDLSVPSRIKPALQNAAVLLSQRSSFGGYGVPTLAVSSPDISPVTGDPVLPVRASGYAGATLVLARSDELARLAGERLEPLANWVLGGGTLAVAITRPEDLQNPALAALAGGRLEETGRAPAEFSRETVFEVVPEDAGSGYGSPRVEQRRAKPSEAVRDGLRMHAGGNLRSTRWGGAASYGLGELHVLAFDATREPAASDAWVRYRMLELVEHASSRSAHVAFPHGELALDDPDVPEIRKLLDPNQGTRWSIALAALVLVLYSLLAGPLNFHLAARRGRPLRALLVLPLASLITLCAIVLLGVLSKGVRGQARHLTLIEAGAGVERGAVTRFRGFYAASASELRVRATERGNVLDVAGEGHGGEHELVVDREGARLEGLRSKPWQTLLVREDGFARLGQGLSVIENGATTLVKSRLGRDLVGVLVVLPGDTQAYYFPRIQDGESVEVRAGHAVASPTGGGTYTALDADSFAHVIDEASPGLGAAWRALADVAPDQTYWWPDVPVVIGQLAGGEGRLVDSGLELRADRVLVRVVGWGGRS